MQNLLECACLVDDFASLGRVERERLLAEDCPAPRQTGEAVFAMACVGRRDIDDIDVGIAGESGNRVISAPGPELAGKRLGAGEVTRADRGDRRALDQAQVECERPGDQPRTQDSPADRSRGSVRFIQWVSSAAAGLPTRVAGSTAENVVVTAYEAPVSRA